MRFPLVLVITFCIAFPFRVMACQSDTDCKVGSKCMKARGNYTGFCVEPLTPVDQNDRKPDRDPLDMTAKKADACSFDLDCEVGEKCVKERGGEGTVPACENHK